MSTRHDGVLWLHTRHGGVQEAVDVGRVDGHRDDISTVRALLCTQWGNVGPDEALTAGAAGAPGRRRVSGDARRSATTAVDGESSLHAQHGSHSIDEVCSRSSCSRAISTTVQLMGRVW